MNTRPTPETDDATLIANDIEHGGNFNAVHVQVSKRLERERDEAREALAAEIKHHTETTAKWNGHHMDLTIAQCDLNKAIRERAEARGQRDMLAAALRMITTFDFSNAIMVTELEEAIDVAWGSITTDVRYEMCRDSFSIGFRMGANSFLENAESTRAENKP